MSRRSLVNALPGRFLQWRIVLSLFFCLALALAPSLAEARAGSSSSSGGGSSMGSRGSRTFDNNSAAPISRSMNPSPQATSPLSGAGAGAGALAGGGSFFQRHPFLTGIAGGFLGSMLFSHMGGLGSVFGGLLTFMIIGLLIFFAIRLFSGRGFSFAGAGGAVPRSAGAAASPAARYRGTDTTVGDDDLNAFQGIHGAVQERTHAQFPKSSLGDRDRRRHGQAGMTEDGLGGELVESEPAGIEGGAGVRQPEQFEQRGDGAVLAEATVEGQEHRIGAAGPQ